MASRLLLMSTCSSRTRSVVTTAVMVSGITLHIRWGQAQKSSYHGEFVPSSVFFLKCSHSMMDNLRATVIAMIFISSYFDIITSEVSKCKIKLLPILNITTNAAAGWKQFQISGQDYLVVANFWDGVPEHGMRANSVLYKVDIKKKKRKPQLNLIPVQNFTTVGAHGWEYIESKDTGYLIVPNYYKCGSKRGPAEASCTSTTIYLFDDNTKRFVTHQSLSTAGPANVQGFSLGGQKFFALGENFDDKVAIYRLQGSHFELHQKLDVYGAGVSAFVGFSAREAYLLSASYHDPSTGWLTRSSLFGWDFLARKFMRIRDIATAGAHHVEAFSVNASDTETKYVFVANDRDDKSSRIKSAVYRFLDKRDKGVLELHQTIPTDGAHGAALLTTRRQNLILAVANFGDRLGKRYHALSGIYVWGPTNSFQLVQEIPTLGATDWESFRIGESEFFAVSNEGADGAPTDSVIYYVSEKCKDTHDEL